MANNLLEVVDRPSGPQPQIVVNKPGQQQKALPTIQVKRPDGKMSVQQFGQQIKTKFPQYQDRDDSQLGEAFLAKYPQYSNSVAIPQAPVPQKPGLLKGIAQSIVKPFARAGVEAYNTLSGLGKAFKGDIEGAHGELDKTRNLGPLGQDIAPTLKNSQNPGFKDALDVAGQGAELGSFFSGIGAGKNILTKTAPSVKNLAMQGLKAGTYTGAVGAGGASVQDDDATVGSVLGDTLMGGVAGGALGYATGALTGMAKRLPWTGREQSEILDAVTPRVTELTPDEYSTALRRGRIQPKTATSPAKYNLNDTEREVALKYGHLFTSKDPVRNSTRVIDEIIRQDAEVGKFLQTRNAIFNNGELKNFITDKMTDITDLTVDDAKLFQVKERMAEKFVKSLEKNDMVTLWQARKTYDQEIERAFAGSPTLQKEIKRGFRNAIQQFISSKTDDETYRGFMKEMTDLYDIQETLAVKATKERGLSAIRKWMTDNPGKAQLLTGITGAGLASAAYQKIRNSF